MRLTILTIFILALLGCGPEMLKTDRNIDTDARITKLLEAREYQLAADESLKLSRLYPENTVRYQQRAVEIYMESGDLYAAKAILKDMAADNENGDLPTRLLGAKIALLEMDPDTALNLLNSTPPEGAPRDWMAGYFETRSRAYEQRGNLYEAVRSLVNMTPHIDREDDRAKNNEKIWALLNKMSLPALNQYRRLNPKSELSSWLELALIHQTMLFQPDLLKPAVSMWKEEYPDHPANEAIIEDILENAARSGVRPSHTALLLPFTGPLEWASQAIRDGFFSAWYASEDYKPVVSIYDCDAINIDQIYSRAVENGADFIIGPLEKSAIENLLKSGGLTVTTLALNTVDTPLLETMPAVSNSNLPMLIQFGLSPEDEARQVAIRANAEGYKRALVIIPNDERGQRLFDAFRTQWEEFGGKIMEQIHYPVNTDEHKTWVKSLLNANSSEKRSAELRARLNRNLRSETRLRNDADMIFLSATPVTARRIVPEFRFYQTRIPIFSTSEIFSGIDNPQLDKDLDNVIFNHMPWVLDPKIENSVLQHSVNRLWSAEKSTYRHFYALGIDAFQLITHLQRLILQDSVKFPGMTGELNLADKGRLNRKLMWAKFSRGYPELLD